MLVPNVRAETKTTVGYGVQNDKNIEEILMVYMFSFSYKDCLISKGLFCPLSTKILLFALFSICLSPIVRQGGYRGSNP